MAKVFISYRRSDTVCEAGRLEEGLGRVLGRRFVFRDAGGILPGEEILARIEHELAAAPVVLLVIGPTWLDELNTRPPEQDYLRRELIAALGAKKTIIPVLVRSATLPAPGALPADLKGVVGYHGEPLDDAYWRVGLDRLVNTIGRPPRLRWLIGLTALVLVGLVFLSPILLSWLAPDRDDDHSLRRMLMGGLLATWVAIVFCFHRRRLRRWAAAKPPH